jgi:hypothetical protein
MKKLISILLLLSNVITAPPVPAQNGQPKKLIVGDELHYIEQGQGEPLILLHGGQGIIVRGRGK